MCATIVSMDHAGLCGKRSQFYVIWPRHRLLNSNCVLLVGSLQELVHLWRLSPALLGAFSMCRESQRRWHGQQSNSCRSMILRQKLLRPMLSHLYLELYSLVAFLVPSLMCW